MINLDAEQHNRDWPKRRYREMLRNNAVRIDMDNADAGFRVAYARDNGADIYRARSGRVVYAVWPNGIPPCVSVNPAHVALLGPEVVAVLKVQRCERAYGDTQRKLTVLIEAAEAAVAELMEQRAYSRGEDAACMQVVGDNLRAAIDAAKWKQSVLGGQPTNKPAGWRDAGVGYAELVKAAEVVVHTISETTLDTNRIVRDLRDLKDAIWAVKGE